MAAARTIGINLCWLAPGIVGGSEEYAVRLLRHVHPLLEDATVDDRPLRLRLYCRAGLIEAHPDLKDRYRHVVMPWPGPPVAARVALESSWLAAISRDDSVVHHLGGTVPIVRSAPPLVTIHDLQPLDLAHNFTAVKRRWLGWMLPYSVTAARLVMAPSRFTADRLRDRLDVPEAKLRVVGHGYEPADEGEGSADHVPVVRRLIGRDIDRFVLYPAIAYRHKRHRDLIRALADGRSELRHLHMVFTGRPGPELPAVMAEAERLGVSDRVHAVGRIPAEDLATLYRSAVALVFPSEYEGFGNPAMEAMALGCPVIASDAGALPEVVADAGLVVPVGDTAAMADAMANVVDGVGVAEELTRRGRNRVLALSAKAGAEQLRRAYYDALGTGGRGSQTT